MMWTLQLYYYQYRYSMDEQVAKDLFPLLRRAVNYYTRIQVCVFVPRSLPLLLDCVVCFHLASLCFATLPLRFLLT